MRVRSLLRRRQADAPRLTIRRHTPWPWRAGPLLLAAVFGAGVAWLAGGGRDASQAVTSPAITNQTNSANGANTASGANTANDANCDGSASAADGTCPASAAAAVTRVPEPAPLVDGSHSATEKADRAMLDRLLVQMKSIEAENGRLKTDLAYLERLLPAQAGEGPVAIRSFEVRPDVVPDQLRYRALLTLGGRGSREFVGNLQFVWTAVIDGRTTTATWPRQGEEGSGALKLAFSRLQRVEGTFPVATGAVVKSVQIRVMERGTVRAQQLAAL